MTLQTFVSPISLGPACIRDNSATTYTLDAAGEYMAWVIQAPKTGTIARIHYYATTVTTDGDGLLMRIETVSATDGNPSGTLVGGSSQITQVTTAANSWNRGTTGLNAAVVRGDFIAVKLLSPPGTTFNGVIRAAFSGYFGPGIGGTANFGYLVNAIPTPTKASSGSMDFMLEYDDGTCAPIMMATPASAVTTTSFNNASSPDERGNLFQLPFPTRVIGFYHTLYPSIGSQTADIVLYNGAGTTLETIALDLDMYRAATPNPVVHMLDTPITLAAATNYRIAIRPTVASNVNLAQFTIDTTAGGTRLRDATLGANWQLTTRTDAGAWTDTPDSYTCLGLIVDQFDDGAGGGGGGIRLVGPGGLA